MSKQEKDKVKKLFYSNKNFDILKNIISDFVKKNFKTEISSKYDKYIIDTMKKIYKNRPENKDNLKDKAYNQILNKATLDETLLYISNDISSKQDKNLKISDRPSSSNLNKENTNKSFEEIISSRRQSLNNIPKPIDFSDPVEKNENAEELFIRETMKREEESKNIQNPPEKKSKKTSGPKKPVQNFTFQNQILSSIEEEPPKINTPLEPVAPPPQENNSLDSFIDNESTDSDNDYLEPSSSNDNNYASFNQEDDNLNNFEEETIQVTNYNQELPNNQVVNNQNLNYEREIENMKSHFNNIKNEIINNKLDTTVFDRLAMINDNCLNISKKSLNIHEVTNNNIESIKDNLNKIFNIALENDNKNKERDESTLTFISTMLDKSLEKLINKLNPKKDLQTKNIVLTSKDRNLDKYNQLNEFEIKLDKSYLVKGIRIKNIHIPEKNILTLTPINYLEIPEINWKDSLVFKRNINAYDEYETGNQETLFESPILINNLTFRFLDIFNNSLSFVNNLHSPTSFKANISGIELGYKDTILKENDYIKLNNFKFNDDTVTETLINNNFGFKILNLNENSFKIDSNINKNPNFIGSFIIAREQIYFSIDLII